MQRRPTFRKGLGAQIVIAGAITAAACAGCGSPSPSPAAAAAAAKPATCAQQYATWRAGPALAAAKNVIADVDTLQADAKVVDIKKMDDDLQQMGKDAVNAQGFPIPPCADPAGYWPQFLAGLQAAGDNASATPGLGGLLTAVAALKAVLPLEAKLTAELAKTAGVKPSQAATVQAAPTVSQAAVQPLQTLPAVAPPSAQPVQTLPTLPTVPVPS